MVKKVSKQLIDKCNLEHLLSRGNLRDKFQTRIKHLCYNFSSFWNNKCRRLTKCDRFTSWMAGDDITLVESIKRPKNGRPPKSLLDCGPRARRAKALRATIGASKYEVLQRASDILKEHGLIEISESVLTGMNIISGHSTIPIPNYRLKKQGLQL